MRLRPVALILTLALGILVSPLAAEAQRPAKVPRIGMLLTSSPEFPTGRAARDAFRQGLRERGYVEGQTIVIEYRSAEGRVERFPELAAELAVSRLTLLLQGLRQRPWQPST